jgi:prophage regulatory protein
VAEKVGYKLSTIYDWMNPNSPRHKAHFPRPSKNGRSNRWFESDIDDFCILEFGGGNNPPSVENGRLANDRGEASPISVIPKRDVNETQDKSAFPSGESRRIPVDIPEKRVPVKQDVEVLRSPAADPSEEQIVCVALDQPQILTAHPLAAPGLIAATENEKLATLEDDVVVSPVDVAANPSLPTILLSTAKATVTVAQTDASGDKRTFVVVARKKHTFMKRD